MHAASCLCIATTAITATKTSKVLDNPGFVGGRRRRLYPAPSRLHVQSENLLACAQLGFQMLAEGYHVDNDRLAARANWGTDDTVDNRSPLCSAEVQGNDVARCLRELTWVTLASGYGGIGLPTVEVEHNSSVAIFLPADNACRVLSVCRHYDHHGKQE